MGYVDVNDARIWIEEEGDGPAVVLVHGGLGDSRLWQPVVQSLAARFRTVRYDLRFFGRSESPGVEFSSVDDLVGVLDALGIEQAALVGLSVGGQIALDAVLAHPQRAWALGHVAAGVSGIPIELWSEEEDAAFESAIERGDLDAARDLDLALWAPLGADDLIRDMWLATPDARGVPDGTQARQPEPAGERLEEVQVPTLVVVAAHDPPAQRELGATAARRIPGARLVEVDSDHYLTLREPEQLGELLVEFLGASAPPPH
jgi:pimeloyl-ACP methyl ester carboxylesterase